MATTKQIEDGVYFLHGDGCAWEAVKIRNGRVVDATEESLYETHTAANDPWGGIAPQEDDAILDDDAADAIIRLVYDDPDKDCYGIAVSRSAD